MVKSYGPDWAAIRDDTRTGAARFWPLLLAGALAGTAAYIFNGVVLDDVRSQEPRLPGYLNYLSLNTAEVLPGAILFALQAGLLLNSLSAQPIGWGAILRRTLRALPAVLTAAAILMIPYLLNGLTSYSDVDFVTWWLAYAGGILAAVGLLLPGHSLLISPTVLLGQMLTAAGIGVLYLELRRLHSAMAANAEAFQ